MFKSLRKIHAAVLIVLSLFFLPYPVQAIEDGIVAIVNDDIITLKDLRDYLHAKILQLRLEGKSPEEIDKNVQELEVNGIQRLIEERLIIDKADKLGVEVREDAINNKYQAIRSNYNSEEEFLAALVADGATITDLKNKITDQLKIQFLVEEEINKKIYVTPKEVTDFYEEHKTRFVKPERVLLNSIYIPYGDNIEAARSKANEALAQLAAGNNFMKTADKYSQGPSIKSLARGQLLPEVEETVFKLKPEDISSIIEVETGFFIFKINKKIPPEEATIEEVKDRITHLIHSQKFRDKLQGWLEDLKKEAFIELK